MDRQSLIFLRASAIALAVPCLFVAFMARRASSSDAAAVPRMRDGHPDLRGVWNYGTITQLERPRDLKGKQVLTEQEAEALEQRQLKGRDIPDRWDIGLRVVKGRRTSLIVDPADGRLPALTDQGQKRIAALAEIARRPASRPEDHGPRERCIVRAGPPILPDAYSNIAQIFQTPEYVGILTELIHDARIVPLDGRPHIDPGIHQWMGDSRGRWDGDTLVVDTTNFSDRTAFRGSSARLHVVERFSRGDADTLEYQFTVEDPDTWTRAWTAVLPMTRTHDQVIEYACHEGNYSNMIGILGAARAEEKTLGKSPKPR